MIMIDTDVFIDNFRGIEKSKKFFEEIISGDKEFYFSVITEAELLSGKECEDKLKMNKVLNLLSLGHKLTIDNNIARTAGDFRRLYNLKLDDAFIGATAFLHNSTLITRNIDDFKSVKVLEVMKPY